MHYFETGAGESHKIKSIFFSLQFSNAAVEVEVKVSELRLKSQKSSALPCEKVIDRSGLTHLRKSPSPLERAEMEEHALATAHAVASSDIATTESSAMGGRALRLHLMIHDC